MLMPHDKRLPLYLQLRDEIAARIAKQEWRAGEAIPTESKLIAQYATSMGTLRKAVDELVKEGLLERFQGKGTFVRRTKFDAALFRFFRFQNAAGERRIPQSRILHRQVIRASSAVSTALRLPPKSDVIEIARLRLLDNEPLLTEIIWLPKNRFTSLLTLELTDFSDLLYPLYEERCGQIVAFAQETLTAEIVSEKAAKYGSNYQALIATALMALATKLRLKLYRFCVITSA